MIEGEVTMKDFFEKILIVLIVTAFIWIVIFFGYGVFNKIFLSNITDAKTIIERRPKFKSVIGLEYYKKKIYCLSEVDNKILVYDLKGKYIETIQLPYSETGQDSIVVDKSCLYIDSASGSQYVYDGKKLKAHKYMKLDYIQKKEIIYGDSRYILVRNKLIKERKGKKEVLQSDLLIFWAFRNEKIALILMCSLIASLFILKKINIKR